MKWIDSANYADYVNTNAEGTTVHGCVWYADGAYLWRVTWDGYVVKNGTGCLDRSEAKREAEHWIGKIDRGEIDPPWKGTSERQALEQRLLDARARSAKRSALEFTIKI